MVRDRLRDLEERKSRIEAELSRDNRAAEIELHPNLPDLYRRKVGELSKLVEDEASRPQATEIIRSLIERIEVRSGKQRGQCYVVLVGALAGILALTQKKRTAASKGDDGTFLMVAGAGFVQDPTMLKLREAV